MARPSFEPEENGTIDRILDQLASQGELYDVLRVVDPVAKKVVERVAPGGQAPPYACTGFWSEDHACRDCLSSRAFQANRRMARLEFHRNRIWLCTSIPIQTSGRGIVVELLRDLGGTLVTSGGEPVDALELQTLLEQIDRGTTIDPASGLLDRRSIDVRLPRELARARSTRYPLSLVLAAIDGAPRLRARYGDKFVDGIVRRVADALKGSMRSEQDWVGRATDDEFLVVMRNTGHAGLATVAERLRSRIALLEVEHEGTRVPVTATFALHIEMPAIPTDGPLIPLLEQKAREAALAGGNRVV